MQQLDELVRVLVFRNDPLLDLELLLQDRHVAVDLSQFGLEHFQGLVLRLLFLDPGIKLLVLLIPGIEINVVVGCAYHGRGKEQDSRPRC